MNTRSDEPGRPAKAPGRAKAEAEADEGRDRRGLGSRAPAFVRSHRVLLLSWQAGIFVAGLLVVIAGIVMLPLPGPGWLVIFGGMAIWATEFVWAQLALRWTKRKVTEAARQALDPRVRRRNIALTAIGLVIVAALAGVYLWRFGTVPPWRAVGR
ncbi:TIGR02611 family protein [Streptomyces sp. NPDC088337]|uniref:TIGR02611 family protein n=1 Tax=unclassified Streptomyces TaxID=2593676 RepID=UPI002DDBEF13|nr:TIGR02611 family protein [Streptomyces sp. NBC_01788]WSB25814.1 TIGR02611 family protein [Streptomyces sp. NBC_01788]